MSSSEKHIFAFYAAELTQVLALSSSDHLFEYHDESLWFRITQVLRLTKDEQVVLFDQQQHVTLALHEKTFVSKKKLFGVVVTRVPNKALLPELVLFQCLTKKTVYEEIVYTAAQLGVTSFVPVISAKVQRSWGGAKEKSRLESIAYSACEQSKNFKAPQFCQPVTFDSVVDKSNFSQESGILKIFFDVEGASLFNFLAEVSAQYLSIKKIMVMIGPEGGLTMQERAVLVEHGFVCYALTPTILRAQDAVLVGIGSIRCMGK